MFCLVGCHPGTQIKGQGLMDELPDTPRPQTLDKGWCLSYLGKGAFHCHVDQFYSYEVGQLKLEDFAWSQQTHQSLTVYTPRVREMVTW